MRVLVHTNSNYKESDFKNKNSEINKFLYVDTSNDIEEAEYLLDIRKYNLMILEYDSSKYKQFYNLFKIINSLDSDFSYKLIIVYNEDVSNLETLKEHTKRIYKNLKIEYIQITSEEKKKDFINKEIKENFYHLPKIIEKYEIDLNKREIDLIIEGKEFNLKIKSKREFRILLFFIQHYGEVLNIDTIMSGTFEEPEYNSNSIIEGAISSIRKTFKKLSELNPVKAHKRIGYEFSI